MLICIMPAQLALGQFICGYNLKQNKSIAFLCFLFFSVTLTEDAPNLKAASKLRILLSNTVDSFLNLYYHVSSIATQALFKVLSLSTH